MSKQRAGINKWINCFGQVVVSEKRPRTVNLPPAEDFAPFYSPSRVRGANYTPYAGSSEWVKAANQAMAEAAASNWQD